MLSHHTRRYSALGLMLGAALALSIPSTATAGCGCDHPPPEWAPVMPIFAPTGAKVKIFSEGRSFEQGHEYDVTFDGVAIQGDRVVAENPDFIEVTVPSRVKIGPASVQVFTWKRRWWRWQKDEYVSHGNDVFTVLPEFVSVPPSYGVYESKNFEVAVDAEGTVLLPLDLSRVVDATQFAFQFKKMGLAFDAPDVVFYSKDGVDLTLFTLAVDDSTERQWGSYYGWKVDEDNDLSGYRYQNRRVRAWDLAHSSDILTYWRHEFHTYDDAHKPGGSHEITADGLHVDGTLHVDHDYIVLAIHGMQRSEYFPDSAFLQTRPRAGRATVRLNAAVVPASGPVEPAVMVPLIEDTFPSSLEDAMEAVLAAMP